MSEHDGGAKPPAIADEVVVATKILGSQVGAELIRYLRTLPDPAAGAYWRDIQAALPHYAETSIRKQLRTLEKVRLVTAVTPFNLDQGNRRGVPIRYVLDQARLDEIFLGTQQWLQGDGQPDVRV